MDRIWAQHVASSLTAELDSRRRRRKKAIPLFIAILQHKTGDPDPDALVSAHQHLRLHCSTRVHAPALALRCLASCCTMTGPPCLLGAAPSCGTHAGAWRRTAPNDPHCTLAWPREHSTPLPQPPCQAPATDQPLLPQEFVVHEELMPDPPPGATAAATPAPEAPPPFAFGFLRRWTRGQGGAAGPAAHGPAVGTTSARPGSTGGVSSAGEVPERVVEMRAARAGSGPLRQGSTGLPRQSSRDMPPGQGVDIV